MLTWPATYVRWPTWPARPEPSGSASVPERCAGCWPKTRNGSNAWCCSCRPSWTRLDRPAARERLEALLEAIEAGDAAGIAAVLSQEIPTSVRNNPAAWSFLRQRMDQLMNDGLAAGLASLPDQVALTDRSLLGEVTAKASGDRLRR